MTRNLDRLLAAAAPDPAAPQPRYDTALGRRRAADRLAAHHRRDLPDPAGTGSTLPAAPVPPPSAVPRCDHDHDHADGYDIVDRQGLTFHDHAERDLTALATQIISEPDAGTWIASLDDPKLDPRGGLVFACLLHLTGHPHEAQWWFQFAAGAGDRSATYCLYLHHIRMGELREAEHWFHQAARLEREDAAPGALPPSAPAVPGYFADTRWMCQYLPTGRPTPDQSRRDQALRGALGQRHQVRDEMAGTFSLPPEDIADSLHALIAG